MAKQNAQREVLAIAVYESHQRASVIKGAAWHKLTHKERLRWRQEADKLSQEEDHWENNSGW